MTKCICANSGIEHTSSIGRAYTLILLLFALCVVLSGCGSGYANFAAKSPGLAFTAISNHEVGDAPFRVSVSSASSGSVSFGVVSGPGMLSGSLLTLTGQGTVVLRATQTADSTYGGQTVTISFLVDVGISSPSPTLIVSPASPTVAVNQSISFTATRMGQPVSSCQWIVLGGVANGSINPTGVFLAPSSVPDPDVVDVGCILNEQLYTAVVAVRASSLVIDSVSPSTLTAVTTSIVVIGSGFSSLSTVTLNSVPCPTVYVDSTHLKATITLSTPLSASLQLVVINPRPAATSNTYSLHAKLSSLNITPSQLSGGEVNISISGSNFTAGSLVFLAGKPLFTIVHSSSSITASGFLAPWITGSVTVDLFSSAGTEAIASQSVPIIATPVSFDAAARFATQAAFGPRPDIVQHIQQVGFRNFIDEQQAQSPINYGITKAMVTEFLESVTQGQSLLKPRIAFALENFIVPSGNQANASIIPVEEMFERDAMGNFRKLMGDVVSDPNIAIFLNLPNNPSPSDPSYHPNQNFAREFMQLFTLGPQRLNSDGTLLLTSAGSPIPTYDQNTVIDLTRALTGWNLPQPLDPDYTAFGVDYKLPLCGSCTWDDQHDHTAKLLFGSVVIPAGQTIEQDRDAALDAIFYHPNLPPFISQLLIQHLVKSNPSGDYIKRVSQVFEDNGSGVRGDLAATVRAVLLDPEARAGDLAPSASDGFIQDPILFQTFAMSTMQIQNGDDQASYIPGVLGEPTWHSPTIFGSYSANYKIPGTSISAPEFALFNNFTVIERSQVLWGMISGQQPGIGAYVNSSWLFANFTTVPELVEALNHLVFHGQMSIVQQSTIIAYCAQLNPFLPQQQLQAALFLALNSDSFTVSH